MFREKFWPERYYSVFRVGHDVASEEFEQSRKKFDPCYRVFNNLSDTMLAIFAAEKYADLPDCVNLNYKDFVNDPTPLKEIITTIRTSVGIMTNKFNRGYEGVKINFRIAEPITLEFSLYLREIGVNNLTPTPSYWGHEVWGQFASAKVPNGYWPDFLINGKSSLKTCEIENPSYEILLTARQEEVAHLVSMKGLSNKQIARQLKISESAVKLHLGNIMKKYGVKNRTQLSRAMGKALSV